MAQTGFILSDEGRTITARNNSGTTAIFAGDIVYSSGTADVLTGTAASARNAYGASDIQVNPLSLSATGYKNIIGVAAEDIPAGTTNYGSIALEGVFIHQSGGAITAGAMLRGTASTANKVVAIAPTQTTTYSPTIGNISSYKVGKALSGASATGKYMIWKLAL